MFARSEVKYDTESEAGIIKLDVASLMEATQRVDEQG